jgi:hypothetical protein
MVATENRTKYQQRTQHERTGPDYEKKNYRTSNPENDQTKNYDTETNRTQAENMAKKKGFTFIQKAGLAGAGITALLFFVKSKILTMLSFLTAIPTAGLLYFGFRKSFSDTTKQTQEKPVEEEKPRQSKETLETISKLNQMKNNTKNPLLKEFIRNVSQTLAATDNFDTKEIVKQLIELMDYQADKQTIKKLQTDLHPDKHLKAPDEEKELYKKLFSIISEYKDIKNS